MLRCRLPMWPRLSPPGATKIIMAASGTLFLSAVAVQPNAMMLRQMKLKEFNSCTFWSCLSSCSGDHRTGLAWLRVLVVSSSSRSATGDQRRAGVPHEWLFPEIPANVSAHRLASDLRRVSAGSESSITLLGTRQRTRRQVLGCHRLSWILIRAPDLL